MMLARSSSRGSHRVRVLAVHTTEGILRATDLRAWSSWPGSSHAAADDGGTLLTPAEGFVPYERASWTLRSGNPWSENIELCGFAGWVRSSWMGRPKLLMACAVWLAQRSVARGIPLVKLTPAQYRAGQSGVIGHHDHTVGYSDGTHWDPGPNFPWDHVLDLARQIAGGKTPPPEDDMFSDNDRSMLINVYAGMYSGGVSTPERKSLFKLISELPNKVWSVTVDRTPPGGTTKLVPALQELADAKSAALRLEGRKVEPVDTEALASDLAERIGTPDVDEERLAAAVANTLTRAIKDSLPTLSPEQVAELARAFNDEQDRRARDGDPATGPVS